MVTSIKKIKHNRAVARYKKKYPERIKAKDKVNTEKRAGRMKPGVCWCGNTKTEAHHPDYNQPLEVIWLCKKHHKELHKRIKKFKEFDIPKTTKFQEERE